MEEKNYRSLKSRFIVTIIPFVIVISGIILILVYSIAKKAVVTETDELLETNSKLFESQIDAWIQNTSTKMENFAKSFRNGDIGRGQFIQVYLEKNTSIIDGSKDGIYVALNDGNIYQNGISKSVDFEKEVKSKAWFTKGLESQSVIVGVGGKDESMDTICFLIQLKNLNDEVVGMAGVDIPFDCVKEIVLQNEIMEDADMFILDSDEKTIVSSNVESLIATNTDENEVISSIISDHSSLEYKTRYVGNGTSYYVSVRDSKYTDWIYVLTIKQQDALKSITDIRTASIVGELILVAAISAVVLLVVSKYMNRLNKMTEQILLMSNGDFTITMPKFKSKKDDEILKTNKSLDEFIKNMKVMLGEFKYAATSISEEAEAFADVANKINEHTDEQTYSMKSMSDVVEQLSLAIQDIASKATELANISDDARDISDNANDKISYVVDLSRTSNEEIKKVTVSISNLQKTVEELSVIVTDVGESAKKIDTIVEVIKDIAEQTNLLSLNASIEAARAGEAGKGFAVVASEIKTLADTSSVNAIEIQNLVSEISGKIKNTVESTHKSASEIRESSELIINASASFEEINSAVNETGEAFGFVKNHVLKVNEIALDMAAVTQQQAAGSEEVMNNVENVIRIAENVSEEGKKIKTEIDELKGCSDKLDKNVARFKL